MFEINDTIIENTSTSSENIAPNDPEYKQDPSDITFLDDRNNARLEWYTPLSNDPDGDSPRRIAGCILSELITASPTTLQSPTLIYWCDNFWTYGNGTWTEDKKWVKTNLIPYINKYVDSWNDQALLAAAAAMAANPMIKSKPKLISNLAATRIKAQVLDQLLAEIDGDKIAFPPIRDIVPQPVWIDRAPHDPDPKLVIPVQNGLLGDSSLISTRNEVTASRFGLES